MRFNILPFTCQRCGGQHFPVHREIVGSASAHFRRLIEEESVNGVLDLTADLKPITLEAMLKFIYCRTITTFSIQFMCDAYKFGMDEFFNKLRELVIRGIDSSDAYQILIVGGAIEDDLLVQAAERFIQNHPAQVVASEYVQKLFASRYKSWAKPLIDEEKPKYQL